MSTWRIAPALEKLREQLNEAFPRRSKASDGGIGDAAHASRSSDHNPWVKDAKRKGVVTARDFTHDPKTGIDCQWLADTLVDNKDPRIKYIIWNKQICSSTKGWEWRSYKGVNAHQHHLHLSVNPDPKFYDSVKQWKLDFPKEKSDDVAKVSAAVAPLHPTVSHNKAGSESSDTTSDQQPPTESKVTTEKGDTKVEITEKNEQDVSQPVTQQGPKPYNEIGLGPTLKGDLKAIIPANGVAEITSQVAEKAGVLPEWAIPLVIKLAYLVGVATVIWLLYRLITWGVHAWRENERVKLEATINTDTKRKNIEIVPYGTPIVEEVAKNE